MSDAPLIVGVDGGGTRGRAWVAPADHDPTQPPRGSAECERACNPYAVGIDAAAEAILAVIGQAAERAGVSRQALGAAFVCVGAAGVERSEEREPLLAALAAGGLRADRLALLGDPWVALEGALPVEHVERGARVLLVAGTGSVAVARRDDGAGARVGGWGSRVGDEGSGAWLGIEAVRATLRALDGRDEPGPLARAIESRWGAGVEALVGRARHAAPADFARLAPSVLELAGDDPAAAALHARAVAALSELVSTAARASAQPVAAVAFTGGVALALSDQLRAALPEGLGSLLREAAGPPVAGAWRLARARQRSPESGRPAR